MIIKKLYIIALLLLGGYSVFAQNSDDFRLRALSFFCSNKDKVFRIEHDIFGMVSPLFLLDIRMNTNEDLYIDSNDFNPDTAILESILMSLKEDAFIDNTNNNFTEPDEGINALCHLCDCVYLDSFAMMKLDCKQPSDNAYDCKREYGLNISKVLPYNGFKYVILKVSSYYRRKIDKLQFYLVEFSTDGIILRLGVGNVLLVD